jgi:anti-sigma B factor antagonist/stage II sporulation protein AA (anti-sigma F factor antagonist)
MTNGICVLRPRGRLDSATGPAFDEEVGRTIAGGANKLLLDMGELQFISSAGLRTVLHAAKQMKSLGGQLVLCSLNEQIKEVFEVSGFTRFLDISSSHEEAVSKLS